MSELHEIWVRARQDGEEFLGKVRLFTHEDTKIWTPADRARIAKHWSEAYAEEIPLLEHMGGSDRVAHLALKKFAIHVGDILATAADSLQPRGLDQLIDHSFD